MREEMSERKKDNNSYNVYVWKGHGCRYYQHPGFPNAKTAGK
jgi:hypothetical protein